MKQLFTTVLILISSFQVFSQTITWGTPITVYSGSGSNLHPCISLNRNGNPYILWGKTDTRAYFSKWNGSGFTAPVVPSGSLTVFAQSWAGPEMAAFGDTVYVSMQVTPECVSTAYAYLAHSYDGGTTFFTPVRMDSIDTSISRFPAVTTTANGNPLTAFMKFNSTCGAPHYVVARSSDFGNTFSTDVLSSGSTGQVCECCPATVISSGSSTAVMLSRNNLSNIRDIWAGISTDGGMTFPNTMAVDTTNWFISSCPASGPDGFVIGDSIYTVFMSQASGTPLVHLSHSSISAASTFGSKVTGMFSGLLSQNYPRIANAGNAATMVWLQNTSSGKSIVYTNTNNISAGFSGYSTVTGATGSGIMNADVAMTPGVVHIVWEDDNTGTIKYVKGTYTVPTALNTLSNTEKIELYPNPATNEFTISTSKLNGINNCYLTDNAGKSIELTPTVRNGKATFSLTGIAKGVYYFLINDTTNKSFYSQLIVQ